MTHSHTWSKEKPWPRTIEELESSPEAMEIHRKAALQWISELEAKIGIDEEEYQLALKQHSEDIEDLS
jgi:hypothetical protein